MVITLSSGTVNSIFMDFSVVQVVYTKLQVVQLLVQLVVQLIV